MVLLIFPSENKFFSTVFIIDSIDYGGKVSPNSSPAEQ
jgi:hypothetical protein